MAQLWTEDDWGLGNAFKSLADSIAGGPKLELYARNVQSQIALRELERQLKAGQLTARDEAWKTGDEYWKSKPLPEPPTVPLQPGEQGPPAFTPEASRRNDEFLATREKLRTLDRLGAAHATSYSDVAKGGPDLMAKGNVALYGAPSTPQDQSALNFMAGHKFEPGEQYKGAKNYVVTDATGNIIDKGVTQDAGRTNNVGRRIVPPAGGSVLLANEASTESGGMFKDRGAQLNALSVAANRIAASDAKPLDTAEARSLAIAMAELYPHSQKIEKDDAGHVRIVGFQEKMLPQAFAPLANHLNTVLYGAPAPTVGPGGAPVVPPPTNPDSAAAAATTAVAPKAPAVPGAAPIVPPPGVTVSEPIIQGTGDKLRNDMMGSLAYKQYLNSKTNYERIQLAFEDDNLAADLNGIYSLAKIFDPDSAVKEGELQMAASTGSTGERLMGLYNSLSRGGGRLTAQMRADILNEGFKASFAQHGNAEQVAQAYRGFAKQQGLDARNVVPDLPAPQPYDPKRINIRTHAPTTGAPAAAPGGAPTRRRVRFDEKGNLLEAGP